MWFMSKGAFTYTTKSIYQTKLLTNFKFTKVKLGGYCWSVAYKREKSRAKLLFTLFLTPEIFQNIFSYDSASNIALLGTALLLFFYPLCGELKLCRHQIRLLKTAIRRSVWVDLQLQFDLILFCSLVLLSAVIFCIIDQV